MGRIPGGDFWELTEDQQKELQEWLRAEDLNPGEIAADDRFSVGTTYISGNKFVFNEAGDPTFRPGKDAPVKVHFRKKYTLEPPEWLQ